LVEEGTGADPYLLAGAGPGSDFSNPVPLTGEPNNQAASFDGAGRLRPDVRDSDFIDIRTATFEVYLNANSVVGESALFALWGSQSQYRQLKFTVNDGFLAAGVNYLGTVSGSSQLTQTSSLSISTGVDYYAAVVV